jgi:hypothetical protein
VQTPALTPAFQTALGMLITNESMAARVIEGKLRVDRIHPGLMPPDIEVLGELLRADGRRVLAIAELASQRRKMKVFGVLPATATLHRRNIDACWRAFLTASGAAPPMFEDAANFARSILARCGTVAEAQVVRFELCVAEVASRLASDAKCNVKPAACVGTGGRLRLSPFVHVERFAYAVDEVMREFRSQGTLRTDLPASETHVVFHPRRGRPQMVTSTRLAPAVAEALRIMDADGGVDVRDLVAAAAPELRTQVQQTIAELLALQVLVTVRDPA